MKTAPVPMSNGKQQISPLDERGQRIYDGVMAGALAVARRDLEQEVRQFEQTLPAKPRSVRRSRAALLHHAAGARNSAADVALVQRMHDALSKLGASCSQGSAAEDPVNPPRNGGE